MKFFLNLCFLATILSVLVLFVITYMNQDKSSAHLENYFSVIETINNQRHLILVASNEAKHYLSGATPDEKLVSRETLSKLKGDIQQGHSNFLLSSHFADADSVIFKDKYDTHLNEFLENIDKFFQRDSDFTDSTKYLRIAVDISYNKLIPILDDVVKGYSEGYQKNIIGFKNDQLLWLVISFAVFIGTALIILLPASHKVAKAYDQLVHRNAMRSRLLAGMNHRLQGPIQDIISTAEGIVKSTTNDNEKKNAYRTINSADTVLYTINDIVDFHQMETGKFHINKEKIEIKNIVKQVCKPLLEEAKNKGLKIKVQFTKELPETIESDSSRFTQVLSNLVTNALRFTEEGHIMVKCETYGDFVKVTVEDTGAGIPEDVQPSIFDWFAVQNELAVDDEEADAGKGFGLSIVKEIVVAMGGEMGLESEMGKGSSFWFTIPTKENAQKPVETEKLLQKDEDKESGPTTFSKKILLVEDNNVSREFTTKILQKLGCLVEGAENGQIAIEKLKDGAFDLVMMDYEMPDMNGAEATKKIMEMASKDELQKVAVVGLTANYSEEHKKECLDAGMDDYFAKCASEKDYINILKQCFEDKKPEAA